MQVELQGHSLCPSSSILSRLWDSVYATLCLSKLTSRWYWALKRQEDFSYMYTVHWMSVQLTHEDPNASQFSTTNELIELALADWTKSSRGCVSICILHVLVLWIAQTLVKPVKRFSLTHRLLMLETRPLTQRALTNIPAEETRLAEVLRFRHYATSVSQLLLTCLHSEVSRKRNGFFGTTGNIVYRYISWSFSVTLPEIRPCQINGFKLL